MYFSSYTLCKKENFYNIFSGNACLTLWYTVYFPLVFYVGVFYLEDEKIIWDIFLFHFVAFILIFEAVLFKLPKRRRLDV